MTFPVYDRAAKLAEASYPNSPAVIASRKLAWGPLRVLHHRLDAVAVQISVGEGIAAAVGITHLAGDVVEPNMGEMNRKHGQQRPIGKHD